MAAQSAFLKRIFEDAGFCDSINRQDLTSVLGTFHWSSADGGDTLVRSFLDYVEITGGESTYEAFIDWIYAPQISANDAIDSEIMHLFKALDTDGSGSLDADEILWAVASLDHPDLTEDAVNDMIIEADINGDGEIQPEEFLQLISPPPVPEKAPHLVLNFDVNQTVIIFDSATGADPEALLNSLLSNTCWGRVTEDGETWELVSTSPSLQSPETGLLTYLQFAVQQTPLDGDGRDGVRAAKSKRRKLIQTFTKEGNPGEKMVEQLNHLKNTMQLPEEVQNKEDAAFLHSLGLHGGCQVLLPSFMNVLRSLKASGRSFSICFRTFGKDLPKIAPEYNALCEGKHPLYKNEPLIVLDGSDGGPDMRMDLTPGGWGLGTWVRDGPNLSLVMGTIEQPPMEQSKAEQLPAFYEGMGQKVDIINGAGDAAAQLRRSLRTGKTIALRDYYPGWEASGCKAHGGKPLLLEKDITTELQMFFDDHVHANDAQIVDVRRAKAPLQDMLPIGAVLGSNLHRAQPLLSITQPNYFLDCIKNGEDIWKLKLQRRKILAKTLDTLKERIARRRNGVGVNKASATYVPHAQLQSVLLASSLSVANILEDSEDEDEDNE
mmetsp:Transcript_50763/g.91147  ORF Transcript_50763/g.91147 Transcript_50763/m.91147 type:complete len:605 (+) Transcript_50763:20-1834(+)|eukprot:CAMPEP_0197631174 /NCGR_PEP_ID=MMETSP1338-20131121/8430_1 /TAXON_ID=43686 ORGANISM="Pelagodinium beii, Strain RCC1491" /NCGR_SAMPLE_ID=MMETSP1338 /ASSEMBLY_ACC=CAM_ASM_000754 /LENGTH=604 /DNA_ID=CAMNT_0043202577 /DNA_START=20 /DNA_END=1834 /DNA_ORIENTATION=+